MKTRILVLAWLISITSLNAQVGKKIETQTSKITDFISYAADYEITADQYRLYIAIESNGQKFSQEALFYLQQGLRLLSKKLPEDSQIAIGAYGKFGSLIQPFNSSKEILDISTTDLTIDSGKNGDGIDLAYQTIERAYVNNAIHQVILVRNDAYGTNENRLSTKNSSDNEQMVSNEISKSRETRESRKTQRKQSDAVNHQKLGGALALTALTILPDILEIIKD